MLNYKLFIIFVIPSVIILIFVKIGNFVLYIIQPYTKFPTLRSEFNVHGSLCCFQTGRHVT